MPKLNIKKSRVSATGKTTNFSTDYEDRSSGHGWILQSRSAMQTTSWKRKKNTDVSININI